MKKNKVIQLVKDQLKTVGHGIVFEVVVAGVRQEGTWWEVPILATRNGKDVPREIAVNIFANVEDDLEQEMDLSVLLIPVMAEGHALKGGKR